MATDSKVYAASLGKRIHRLRLKKGIGLRELARRAEISPSYLSEIEQGINVPSVDKVQRLSAALDVPLDTLLPAA